MISRADAHRAAIHLIDALGPEAAKAAHERSSEMLTLGDAGRYEVWAMILDAIEDILDQEPACCTDIVKINQRVKMRVTRI